MKETRLINRFSEKGLIWGNGSFWAQKLHILVTLDPLKEFFKNFAQCRGLVGDINNFQTKFFVWGKWTILGPKTAHPHNSGSAVRIFFKFCTVKRADR